MHECRLGGPEDRLSPPFEIQAVCSCLRCPVLPQRTLLLPLHAGVAWDTPVMRVGASPPPRESRQYPAVLAWSFVQASRSTMGTQAQCKGVQSGFLAALLQERRGAVRAPPGKPSGSYLWVGGATEEGTTCWCSIPSYWCSIPGCCCSIPGCRCSIRSSDDATAGGLLAAGALMAAEQ